MTTHELQSTPVRARSSTWRVVAWLCAGVCVVRALYVTQPLRSDEGGYLLVARQWRAGGEFLYGDYHADRPPFLLAIFKLAALTEWDGAIRLLSIPFALVFVVAAARAGQVASGETAARWSALVAAGLVSSPALAADQADGELFAAPFVMLAVAVVLDAWRREPGRAQLGLAVAAGASASAASLVKQNFLEAFVFVVGLVAADTWTRRSLSTRSRVVLAGTLVGGVLPNALVYVWARAVGIDGLRIWQELATFRKEAFGVIWGQSTQAPVTRAVTLVLLAIVSGTVMVLVRWALAWREDGWPVSPLHWAVALASAYGLVAIVAGGSYWPHYLLQLAAMTSLAAGVVATARSPAGHRMRFWGRYVAGSAVVGALVLTIVYASVPWVWFQQRTGEWLALSSRPGDSTFVAYGSPSILESADLPAPYPYLWSLPMRTLDPEQARLRATLVGPDAPTWVVAVTPLNSWDIDDSGRLRSLVETRYRVVETVCGYDVWLRSDADRDLAPVPDCADRLPFLRDGSGGG